MAWMRYLSLSNLKQCCIVGPFNPERQNLYGHLSCIRKHTRTVRHVSFNRPINCRRICCNRLHHVARPMGSSFPASGIRNHSGLRTWRFLWLADEVHVQPDCQKPQKSLLQIRVRAKSRYLETLAFCFCMPCFPKCTGKA